MLNAFSKSSMASSLWFSRVAITPRLFQASVSLTGDGAGISLEVATESHQLLWSIEVGWTSETLASKPGDWSKPWGPNWRTRPMTNLDMELSTGLNPADLL